MKIEGKFRMELWATGAYMPCQGHSSSLKVNGEEVLVDDYEEGQLSRTRTPQDGDTLESSTLKSTIRGVVKCLDWSGHAALVEVTGAAEGTVGSILGGISCHASWQVSEIRTVEGRFGKFSGSKALENYEEVKHAHRRAYFTEEVDEQEFVRPRLTPLGEKALEEIGLCLHYHHLESIARLKGDIEAPYAPHSLAQVVDGFPPAEEMETRLRRKAQWEAFKSRYRGTRLNKAAIKAGFGDMVSA